MTVVSVTLPDDLIEKFDEFSRGRGYFSRSEAFRDALRTLMSEAAFAEQQSEKVASVILTACDIRRRDIDVKLVELRSEFEDAVVENLHRFVENEYCIDIFLVQGEQKRILDFLGRVRGTRGVQQVKTIFLPLKSSKV